MPARICQDVHWKQGKAYRDNQRGRGHWAVYYTSPQSFFIFIEFGLLGSFSWVSADQSFLIVIYRRGSFAYLHRWCSLIYWPLSYPFRYLEIIILCKYVKTEGCVIYYLTLYAYGVRFMLEMECCRCPGTRFSGIISEETELLWRKGIF